MLAAEFQAMGEMTPEQLVRLADTIPQVSEEIYEHYRALRELLKKRLSRIRQLCRQEDVKILFPDPEDRRRLAYALEKACAMQVVLPEKYEELAQVLSQ